MKRLILTALCICLMLSLTACSGKPEPTEPPAAPTAAPTSPMETIVPTAAPTEAPVDNTLSDLTLADNDHCRFTVTGTEYNEHLGLQVHVLCENKSGRPLMFTWNNVSVCGFMYDPMWAEEVAAGKQVHSTIGIDTYALERIGVDNVEEISFTLFVQDSEEFMNEPVVNEGFTVYPTGKTPDQVVFPQYQHKEGETVIVDNDQLTFIIENVDDELADYYTLNCYIANHTGKNILVSWDNVSVNGFMVNPFWAISVAAGKQAYTEIIFYRTDLDVQNVEVVQNIEFELLVSDNDNWDADYLHDQIYTFKPKN